MRNDPRSNLKWLERELMAEEEVFHPVQVRPETEYDETEDLLELVDQLIGEEEPEEPPLIRNYANNYGRQTKGQRAEQAHIRQQFDKSSAVLTKTRAQLRREARLQKITGKKAKINRNIKDLVFLAILEILGILAILGWWLQ